MDTLPLFPLGTVVFPEGRLHLKIFEARYLDLMSRCMRERSSFGVIGLLQGHDVMHPVAADGHAVASSPSIALASIGTSASLGDVDVPRAGLMNVCAVGERRFRLIKAEQQALGLWVGQVEWIDPEPSVLPPTASESTAAAALTEHDQQLCLRLSERLRPVLAGLTKDGITSLHEPRWDDASWVAARWAELLPNPVAQKTAVLETDDASHRLALVQGMLKTHGLVV